MNDRTAPPTLIQNTSLGKDQFHVEPTGYYIEELKLFPAAVKFPSNEGVEVKGLDIRGQAQSIIITEGIKQNAIHVSIGMIDAVGILDTLRIQGGEKINLDIYQNVKQTEMFGSIYENFKKPIKLELYISDIKNFEKPKIDTQTYIIECVTKPAYINQLTVLNKEFEGVPAQLIKDIVEGPLEIEDAKNPLVEENNNFAPNYLSQKEMGKVGRSPKAIKAAQGYGKSIKGIYPKLRPFNAINWLLRNANDNGSPVFFFQSLLYGYQLLSWEDFLYRPDPYDATFEPYSNSPLDEHSIKLTVNDPEYYDSKRRNIISIRSTLGFSKYNDARKGAYASKLTAVDLSTKNYKSGNTGKVYDYKEDQMVKLNKYKPFSTKPEFNDGSFEKNKNSRNFFVNENKHAFSSNKRNYHSTLDLEAIQKKESYLANMNMLTHNIEIPGDPLLTAGSKIELKIWKIQDWNQPIEKIPEAQEKGDELMSGNFVIKQIHHKFQPSGYTMDCELIKDSSLVDFDEELTLK